jgi:prepilin-type N-terminal cleavage/methylation domain-containing protein
MHIVKPKGFVLIELIVVMGMLAIMTGMITISTLGSQRRAALTATVDTLVADLRSQQTKAMTGVTSGGVIPAGYGIRFQQDRYIMFRGATYSAIDSANAPVIIDTRVNFSQIALPNFSIIFASKSGEVVGFDTQLNTVTVGQLDSTFEKTIHFNRYGIITSIN